MSRLGDNEGVHVQSAPVCYLCGRPGVALYADLRDRLFAAPGLWSLRRCQVCTLVWLDPRPLAEEVAKLYNEYFTHTVCSLPAGSLGAIKAAIIQTILPAAFDYPEAHPRGLAGRLGRLLAHVAALHDLAGGSVLWLQGNRRGRLLDVGCGNGQLLAEMRARGWEVVGLDPDPAAVGIAREHFGLEVRCGTLEAASFGADAFDAITLNHTLEHLSDPITTLKNCRSMLRPGGRLVVLTPNSQSLGARWFGQAWLGWDPPRHLFVFSLRSLRQCAEAAGLRIQQLRTTARTAVFTWQASRVLQQEGRLPGGAPSRSLRRAGAGLLFWGAEQLLLERRGWGEEIVLSATKA